MSDCPDSRAQKERSVETETALAAPAKGRPKQPGPTLPRRERGSKTAFGHARALRLRLAVLQEAVLDALRVVQIVFIARVGLYLLSSHWNLSTGSNKPLGRRQSLTDRQHRWQPLNWAFCRLTHGGPAALAGPAHVPLTLPLWYYTVGGAAPQRSRPIFRWGSGLCQQAALQFS